MTSDPMVAMGFKLKVKMDAELFHSLALFLMAHEHDIAVGVDDYGELRKIFVTMIGFAPRAIQ